MRDSGVKIIKDSILNSGWDDSTVFIISVVSEDENLLNPEKVKSDPTLLAKILEHCAFIFVNGNHRDKARKLWLAEKFEKFPQKGNAWFAQASRSGIIFDLEESKHCVLCSST